MPPAAASLSGRRKTGHDNQMKTVSHHNTLVPLDVENATKEELLEHMSIHEARILKQSLAAQKMEMETKFGPHGSSGFGEARVPFNHGGRPDVMIPKLHIPKGNEAQYAGIGFGIDSAKSRAPVFGKKRHATVDNDCGNCLAGCFIIGGPNPPKMKASPRSLPPLETNSARQPSIGTANNDPFHNSRKRSTAVASFADDCNNSNGADAAEGDTRDLNSPTTLKANPMMKALLEPRKFRSDSGVFGEVEAPSKPRLSGRGKSRQFTDSYWGNI